jgi:polyisoprenoid-binding protein YceI
MEGNQMKHFASGAWVAAAVLTLAGAAVAAPVTYKVDGAHSFVVFKVVHLNVANAYGRFNDVTGTVVADEEAPEKGSIDIQIKAESIDTGNEKRDQHLKGPDFLNTQQFPMVTFKSKSIKKTSDKEYEVTGDLSMHGVTKPVTAKLVKIGEGKGMRGEYRAGAEARFQVKRSEFGITYMPEGLSEEVDVIVALEGIRQ